MPCRATMPPVSLQDIVFWVHRDENNIAELAFGSHLHSAQVDGLLLLCVFVVPGTKNDSLPNPN